MPLLRKPEPRAVKPEKKPGFFKTAYEIFSVLFQTAIYLFFWAAGIFFMYLLLFKILAL